MECHVHKKSELFKIGDNFAVETSIDFGSIFFVKTMRPNFLRTEKLPFLTILIILSKIMLFALLFPFYMFTELEVD
jgi:hypothetical protein